MPSQRERALTWQRLSAGLENYRAGQTGLLRLTWDNGDRTVLVNPNLRGMTLGWNLQSTAQDELFAAIEGTALHTRVILDRMAEHGVPIKRVINAGGIPQKNAVLNQVYANVLGRPVLVPSEERGEPRVRRSLRFWRQGRLIRLRKRRSRFALLIRNTCRIRAEQEVYEVLYPLFRKLYFAFGSAGKRPPV